MKLTVIFSATLTTIAIGLGIDNPAQAITTQFTDLATFNASTTGIQAINFEGLNPSPSYVSYGVAGLNVSGVNFQGPASNYLTVIDDPIGYNFNSGAVLYTPLGSIRVTLPTGINAIAFDSLNISPSLGYEVIFSDGLTSETFGVVASNLSGSQFAGFISSRDIAWISFGRSGSYNAGYSATLDNFKFGTGSNNATSVPEPFTIIGTLIGGTAALRLRKKLKVNK
jgi:hypothetical protein